MFITVLKILNENGNMKHEDKELLLKDLCHRLLYGVKGRYNNTVMSLHMVDPFNNYRPLYCVTELGSEYIGIDEFKPYLFPLSSMTEEQRKKLFYLSGIDIIYGNFYTNNEFTLEETLSGINWLLKNHFDIYGLIPIGLAEDATGKNIY